MGIYYELWRKEILYTVTGSKGIFMMLNIKKKKLTVITYSWIGIKKTPAATTIIIIVSNFLNNVVGHQS